MRSLVALSCICVVAVSASACGKSTGSEGRGHPQGKPASKAAIHRCANQVTGTMVNALGHAFFTEFHVVQMHGHALAFCTKVGQAGALAESGQLADRGRLASLLQDQPSVDQTLCLDVVPILVKQKLDPLARSSITPTMIRSYSTVACRKTWSPLAPRKIDLRSSAKSNPQAYVPFCVGSQLSNYLKVKHMSLSEFQRRSAEFCKETLSRGILVPAPGPTGKFVVTNQATEHTLFQQIVIGK